MEAPQEPHGREDFEIVIICALRIEFDAVEALFDYFWETKGSYGKAPRDPNAYTTGQISGHDVVLAYMPGMGKANAAGVAANLLSSFPSIKLGLLVGICGGVPTDVDGKEILLGDVIVGTGVIEYDFGRQFSDRVVRKDGEPGHSGRPDAAVAAFLVKIAGLRTQNQLQQNTLQHLEQLLRKDEFEASRYPGTAEDKLYKADYLHKHRDSAICSICTEDQDGEYRICDAAHEASCGILGCSDHMIILRDRLKNITEEANFNEDKSKNFPVPVTHFGLIASGDLVMRSATHRDDISSREKVIAFEMEGAGLNRFPAIVIKGVCDYADSHKNKTWQRYAAAVAASYMKAMLKEWRKAEKPLNIWQDNQLILATSRNRPTNSALVPGEAWQVRLSESEEKHQLLSRISDYDCEKAYERLISKHLSGTSEWFLQHPVLKEWMQDSKTSSLWCSGRVGCGKTMICTKLIQALKDRSKETKVPIFFFYCDASNQNTTKAKYLMSSIIRQLAEALVEDGRHWPSSVARKIQRYYTPSGPEPDLDDLFGILVDLFSCFPSAYYVIDGIDELDPKGIRQVMSYHYRLLDGAAHQKLFVSSRDEIGLNTRIDLDRRIQLSEMDTAEDIRRYIGSEITRKTKQEAVLTENKKVLDEVRNTLSDKACGMFLWVRLQLEALWLDCENDRDIMAALEDLPEDLATTYRRCLGRIPTTCHGMARKILRWLLCATRPLHIDELREVVGFDLNDKEWDPSKCPPPARIMSSCANLIVLDETDQIVRITHSSARQFIYGLLMPERKIIPHNQRGDLNDSEVFFDIDLEAGQQAKFDQAKARLVEKSMPKSLSKESAHSAYLKQANLVCGLECVNYLSFTNFGLQVQNYSTRNISTSVPGPANVMASLPLPKFAGAMLRDFWSKVKFHEVKIQTQRPRKSSNNNGEGSKYSLLNYARGNWTIHTKNISPNSRGWKQFKMLVFQPPSSWHLHPWTASGQSINSHLHGLLAYAAREGHIPLLQLLLKRDISRQVKDFWNIPLVDDGLPALHAASRLGRVEVVKLLLEVCRVNATDSRGEIALHHAVAKNHFSVIHMLMRQKGVNLSHKSLSGETPFKIAASSGYHEVVEAFLQFNILINGDKSDWENCMIAASENGHTNVLEVLIPAIVKVQQLNKILRQRVGSLAIIRAAYYGHAATVDILRSEADISVNSIDKHTQDSPLLSAARMGHVNVVELLLKYNDIDINIKDGRKRTLLMYAAIHDRPDVMERLLSNEKTDTNSRDTYGRTAVSYAVEKEAERCVTILLYSSFDVDASLSDDVFGQPLYFAIRNGHRKLMNWVLLRPEVKLYSFGTTAVSLAVKHGHFDVTEELLIYMFDSSSKYPRRHNLFKRDQEILVEAYLTASDLGRKDIVELIVDRGLLYLAGAYVAGSPLLIHAARNGHDSIFKLLAQFGSDGCLDYADSQNQTPLIHATIRGHEAIVKELLKAKMAYRSLTILINRIDSLGKTALIYAAIAGHDDIAKLLLQCRDIKVNYRDRSGKTALIHAAERGHTEIVRLLLERDEIFVHAGDKWGQTAFDYAQSRAESDLLKLFTCRET